MHWLPKERDEGKRILRQQMRQKGAWMYRALILACMLQACGIDTRDVMGLSKQEAQARWVAMGEGGCVTVYIGRLADGSQNIWRCLVHQYNSFAARGVYPASCPHAELAPDD